MKDNSKRSEKRFTVIRVFVILWVLAIGYKLVRLQVGEHEWLRARAERQQQAEIDLSPTRGIVYDRNGNELARSVEAKSLYASPAEIRDPEQVADQLSTLLDVDRDALLRRLTSKNLVLVSVKRKISDKEASQVEALNIAGLRFVNEMKRHYLEGKTAAHVLGFVDLDEHGKGGLEQVYDKQIRGQGGRLLLDVDALKKSYDHSVEESVPGSNLTLTVDSLIQRFAEQALAEAVRQHHAKGGTIVMMRPATGEILALANYPSYDPNEVGDSDDVERRNRAIETSFEPGSIFKLVTYSAALEEKLIRPDTLIDCQGGEIRIGDRIIHDGHYGILTAAQALAKSSNVAAIKIGRMLGNERLGRYIEQFGFGRRTGIELPAEARGLFRPASEWGETSIGSIPMGHEIGVTAVQAVAAYACVANGGVYVKPHLVLRIVDAAGNTIEEPASEPRRVISEQTAETIKQMLEGVVMHGTGKHAQLGGYSAAGKTGTAQKIDEQTKRYSQTKYVASFAGFAPVESPEIACIVSIDEPVGAHHGGDVAAPIFARVVAQALRTLGVQPASESPAEIASDDIHVYDIGGIIDEKQLATRIEAAESQPAVDIATDPRPVPAPTRGGTVMPDLRGLSIREALALCTARGLKIKPTGEGVIALQNPSPGALVAQDAVCIVRLSRQYIRKDLARREPGTPQ